MCACLCVCVCVWSKPEPQTSSFLCKFQSNIANCQWQVIDFLVICLSICWIWKTEQPSAPLTSVCMTAAATGKLANCKINEHFHLPVHEVSCRNATAPTVDKNKWPYYNTPLLTVRQEETVGLKQNVNYLNINKHYNSAVLNRTAGIRFRLLLGTCCLGRWLHFVGLFYKLYCVFFCLKHSFVC